MKTNRLCSLAALLFLSTINSQLSIARAQGALTPPGAPAPTMKTLDQIEPRTPISSAPFTISASGSYYLTTNLTTTVSNAIAITAKGVTLDLNGFTIASTVANAANGGTAILLVGTATEGSSDITICNGHILGGVTNNLGVFSGSGFANGVYFSGLAPENVQVLRMTVSGCLNNGIYLSFSPLTVVESCTVKTVGALGIAGDTVKGSVASNCGGTGINGNQVFDCNGSGGDYGVFGVIVNNCKGSGNTGIYSSSTANNCRGTGGSAGNGVSATIANNCYGYSGGIGVNATGTAQNCYGESTGTNNGVLAAVAMNCSGKSQSGIGLRFTQLGAMCWGVRTSPAATNYVVGGGLAGPINLP